MALAFSRLAEGDLADIADYIATSSPERAMSFIARLRTRCMRIGDFPLAMPLRPEIAPGIRVVPFGRYLIFYDVHDDDVVIERIIHGARDYAALFKS